MHLYSDRWWVIQYRQICTGQYKYWLMAIYTTWLWSNGKNTWHPNSCFIWPKCALSWHENIMACTEHRCTNTEFFIVTQISQTTVKLTFQAQNKSFFNNNWRGSKKSFTVPEHIRVNLMYRESQGCRYISYVNMVIF